MSTLPFETASPTKADQKIARESSHSLAAHELGKRASIRIQILDDADGATITLPRAALQLLQQALDEMVQGHAVTLISTQAEVTTQQAADLLNVSRPYLVKLLEEKKIPNRLVGNTAASDSMI